MLTELVKALEEKKAILEMEVATIHEKLTFTQAEDERLAQEDREKEHRLALINDQSIKDYKALWHSYSPGNPFPCPFCFVFDKKTAQLKPMPRTDDVEPLKCSTCGETFKIPIELLYA
jgi:hypothetical protein